MRSSAVEAVIACRVLEYATRVAWVVFLFLCLVMQGVPTCELTGQTKAPACRVLSVCVCVYVCVCVCAI
jgi:hypothetical protein